MVSNLTSVLMVVRIKKLIKPGRWVGSICFLIHGWKSGSIKKITIKNTLRKEVNKALQTKYKHQDMTFNGMSRFWPTLPDKFVWTITASTAPLNVGMKDGIDTLAINNIGRGTEAKEHHIYIIKILYYTTRAVLLFYLSSSAALGSKAS